MTRPTDRFSNRKGRFAHLSVLMIVAGSAVTFGLGIQPTFGQALSGEYTRSSDDFADLLLESESDLASASADLSSEEILNLLEDTQRRLAELESASSVADKPAKLEKPKPKTWFEKYRISGYTQFRINETTYLAPGSAPAQHVGDGSVGEDENFFIRRARVVLQGDVTDRISIYFQPDFASSVPGSSDSNMFVQLRDLYADLYFDESKEYRVRVGQSKIPYGWENLQSSRNRIPLDRNDGLNSAVKNERDLGAFFYWTPEYAQEFFQYTVDEGLKGSGNYGVFGLGIYNGQGGSLQEQNDNLHVVSRLTVPYSFADGQLMEVGVQGYTGKYTVLSSAISPLGVGPAVRPGGLWKLGMWRAFEMNGSPVPLFTIRNPSAFKRSGM